MKKYVALSVMMIFAAAAVIPAVAETFDCGHGCKITCPDGGGCVYGEDTGRCSTFCNDNGVMKLQAEEKGEAQTKEKQHRLTKDSKLTVRFDNVTSEQLKKALGQLGL